MIRYTRSGGLETYEVNAAEYIEIRTDELGILILRDEDDNIIFVTRDWEDAYTEDGVPAPVEYQSPLDLGGEDVDSSDPGHIAFASPDPSEPGSVGFNLSAENWVDEEFSRVNTDLGEQGWKAQ